MPRQKIEHFDPVTGTYYIQEIEDIEPLLGHLSELRNHNDHNAYKKSPARWRHLGTLPMIIIEQWLREDPPFNALKKENAEEVLKRVQRDYPYLLAVNKV